MNDVKPDQSKDLRLFAHEVIQGLSAQPKSLPCRFFYDEEGARLFEAICHLPEYYVPRAETEIIVRHSDDLALLCCPGVEVVEMGPGNAVKTRLVLDRLLQHRSCSKYVAIDISPEILKEIAEGLRSDYPTLTVLPIVAEYQNGLRLLQQDRSPLQWLILWFGTSIGNLEPNESYNLLRSIRQSISTNDLFVIGIDLRKDRTILERAYDDSAGITAQFNLNILSRINRELGGHFDLNTFRHQAVYNEAAGRVEMYLVSQCDQRVAIDDLELEATFTAGEAIHTENSYKFSPDEILALAQKTGFRVLRQWYDSDSLFSVNVFSPVGVLT